MGRTITIDVEPSDSIWDIKAKVQDKDGVPSGQQRVIFAGKQLEDGCLAVDCHLTKGDTIHLLGSLRGGTVPRTGASTNGDEMQVGQPQPLQDAGWDDGWQELEGDALLINGNKIFPWDDDVLVQPNGASIRLTPTRAIVQQPTVAPPLTPAPG